MDRLPTRRWLVTRAELAIAWLCVAIALWLVLARPTFVGGEARPAYDDWLEFAGILGTIVGTLWMVRMARRDPEAGPSPWRYRDPRGLSVTGRRIGYVAGLAPLWVGLLLFVSSPAVIDPLIHPLYPTRLVLAAVILGIAIALMAGGLLAMRRVSSVAGFVAAFVLATVPATVIVVLVPLIVLFIVQLRHTL